MTAPRWRIEESTNDALVRTDLRAVIRNVVDDCSIEILAGHPDGHPLIGREIIRRALLEKHDYAAKCGMKLYVVTQFLFDTQKLLAWHADFIEHTIPGVPIDVGLPGLAKATTLLRFAKECGVATSLGMLTRNPARALRLATSFSPEESLIDLALDARRAGRSRFRSMHFFPFGSFDRTTEWLEALAAGNFRVDQSARAIHPN